MTEKTISRRTFAAGVTTTLVAAVAGCSGSGNDSAGETETQAATAENQGAEGSTDTADEEDAATEEPTETEAETETDAPTETESGMNATETESGTNTTETESGTNATETGSETDATTDDSA
jgi:hypothetical protein